MRLGQGRRNPRRGTGLSMKFIQCLTFIAACSAASACGDDAKESNDVGMTAKAGAAAQGGKAGAAAQGGSAGAATSDGGAVTSNGGAATSDGGAATSDGGAATSDGGAATSDGGMGGAAAVELDPQVPPADAAKMADWLKAWSDNNWEEQWVCEASATAKTEGAEAIHVHNDADGKNRVCSNKAMAAAAEGATLPVGAAGIKFKDSDIYVEVKVAADSAGGDGWYWYGPGGMPAGTGVAGCTGCHGEAGKDADHPGFGDYAYFQVTEGGAMSELDPQVPPADAAKMAEWLKAWSDNNWETEWVCEATATAKTEGAAAIHVHNDADGKNRVCSNKAMAAAQAGTTLPVGAAGIKFKGEDTYVEVKVAADSAEGQGWYWYAPGGTPEGLGVSGCTGCHGEAGKDADHPGFGDYAYFQVTE